MWKGSEKKANWSRRNEWVPEPAEAAMTPMWPNWFRSWEWERSIQSRWRYSKLSSTADCHPQASQGGATTNELSYAETDNSHTLVRLTQNPCSKCSRKSLTLKQSVADGDCDRNRRAEKSYAVKVGQCFFVTSTKC